MVMGLALDIVVFLGWECVVGVRFADLRQGVVDVEPRSIVSLLRGNQTTNTMM